MTRFNSSICVATHHASVAALLADAEFTSLARRPGFLIELRLDFFQDLDAAGLERLMDVFGPQVLVTFRHPAEGGKRADVSDAERLRFLQLAANRGAQYIDIEARTPRGSFNKQNAQLILSHHDFERAPDLPTLSALYREMSQAPGVDIVKIAVMPQTIFDTLPLLQFMNSSIPGKTILLAMGEAGLWTRALAAKFGAPLTYARGADAPGTAPGQLSWRQLLELYRYLEQRPDWPVYGVIGNPVGHSLSPLMHNTALKQAQLPGVYLPFKVEGDPAQFVKAFSALGLVGVSVTIPHKEAVMAVCSEINAVSRAIGAVNTLYFAQGQWLGSNTDAEAAADSLEIAANGLRNKRVLIIGAGGAARAVAFGVKARGADVLLLNRTRERAEALARDTGATAVTYEDIAAMPIDAVVNTTPLGMYPKVDAAPLEEMQIPQGGLVFDTVYNPLRTKLLNLAERRGCKTLEGLEMFVGQGARQFELWTGQPAPRTVMRSVVLDELMSRQK